MKRVSHRDRLASLDLAQEERDDRAAARHDVAVAGHADGRPNAGDARLGDGHLLHHRPGDPHGIDRVNGLVGREDDDPFHSGGQRRVNHVLRAESVGAERFHREELARGDLLQRSCVEDEVHTSDGVADSSSIPNVSNVEAQLWVPVRFPHVVLLLLIAAEDADLGDVSVQESTNHGVPEGPGSPSYQ